MPYSRKRCKRCLRPPPAGTAISARGLCDGCRKSALVQNIIELEQGHGPRYDHWLDRCIEAMAERAARRNDRVRVPH